MFLADRFPRYEAKDRLLAYLGPVAILVTLASWLSLFYLGFALLFWPLVSGDIGTALSLSGSSLFTLAIPSSSRPGPTPLEFLAPPSALISLALHIPHPPSAPRRGLPGAPYGLRRPAHPRQGPRPHRR